MNDRSQSCCDFRSETDFYDSGVLRAYRSFLIRCGLWPYESLGLKQARRIVWSMGLASIILVQITVLFTKQLTVDLLLNVSPCVIIAVILLVKYVTFWIKYKGYEEVLEHMRIDWNNLTKVEQIPLKRAYEVSLRYCTLIFVLTYSFSAFVVIIYFSLKILFTTTASNVSQSINPLIMTEYFVDSEKYFVPISIHLCLTCFFGATAQASADCVNTMIQMHISGIFQVIGLLLTHMFDKPEITNQKIDEALVHYERLLRLVDWHRRNLKLCQSFKSCLCVSGVIQLSLMTLGITTILLKLNNLTSPVQDVRLIMAYTFLLCLCCFYTFIILMPSQTLYENSYDMFFKAYCGCWYTAPMKSQKLLLFLMQRLMTPYKLEMENILSATIETSTLIVRRGFSYFMVLRGVQE